MSLDVLWTLVSKKLAGEASEADLRDLEEIVQQHPDWQNAIEQMEQLWKQQPHFNMQEVEDAYLTHLCKLEEKKIFFDEAGDRLSGEQKSRKLWRWLAAASVLLLLSLFLYSVYPTEDKRSSSPLTVSSEVSSKSQSKSRLQLPDGSTVWLNAGSKLIYSPDFGQKNREVELIGEAFFDVAKLPGIPFIISTTNVKIKVLGTAFNVKAYEGDKVTETSLVRGRIEVTLKNRPEKTIVLSPFEKLVVDNESQAKKVDTVNRNRSIYTVIPIVPRPTDSTIVETSWIQDELIFREERFEDLARMMEIRYKVSIIIRDPKLKALKFSGSWKDETIEKALEALQFTVPFTYKTTPEGIIIQ
ncbi:MAG TPA: FecR domain-containing protein [Chitinophagaceae bacterium]|nr:FecR domain-containing protein [Chitinophagaceae bacterium]